MPLKLASEIAALIQSDPVMARQIKEHIKPAELTELLELKPEAEAIETPPTAEELNDFEKGEILEFVITHYTIAEILEAYRLGKR